MTKLVLDNIEYTSHEPDTILNIALKHGLFIPFGCKDGRCGACKVDILSENKKLICVNACQHLVQGHVICKSKKLIDRSPIDIISFPLKIEGVNQFNEQFFEVQFVYPPSVKFTYYSGQYIEIAFPGWERRAYSIFRAYGNKLSILVSKVTNGIYSSSFLDTAIIQKRLTLRGPLGGSLLPLDCKGKQIRFICTGSGISPILNILSNLSENSFSYKVHWGLRKKRHNFIEKLILPNNISENFMHYYSEFGERVTDAFSDILDENPDIIYVAGNPNMVEEAEKFFIQKGHFSQQQFISDPFYV